MAGTLVIDTLKSSTTTPPTVQNTNGTEVGQFCRAWVNFNPTSGSAVISASFNVSSVTYNATGAWTVNFANSLPDANYAVASTSKMAGSGGSIMVIDQTVAPTASACKLNLYNTVSGNLNVSIVTAAFFR